LSVIKCFSIPFGNLFQLFCLYLSLWQLECFKLSIKHFNVKLNLYFVDCLSHIQHCTQHLETWVLATPTLINLVLLSLLFDNSTWCILVCSEFIEFSIVITIHFGSFTFFVFDRFFVFLVNFFYFFLDFSIFMLAKYTFIILPFDSFVIVALWFLN